MYITTPVDGEQAEVKRSAGFSGARCSPRLKHQERLPEAKRHHLLSYATTTLTACVKTWIDMKENSAS